MENIIIYPLVVLVAVFAILIFRGLTNPEKPGIVQRVRQFLDKKGGGSGDDGGG